MRIHHVEATPFHCFPHRIAVAQGQSGTHPISLYRGTVSGLPESLDALLVASDLQGIAPLPSSEDRTDLVGIALAQHLVALEKDGAIPSLANTGVILAGDLYSAPGADKRGVSGDVRSVWRAFADRCRWVVGVAGNHDTFGETKEDASRFKAEPGIFLLEGTTATLDGLCMGGVGGIIGNRSKRARRDEKEFLREMRSVLAEKPDVLVMHHGPDAQRGRLQGHPSIRRALDACEDLLVICGHVYWPEPTTDMRGGAQALNVDGRVVLLEAAKET